MMSYEDMKKKNLGGMFPDTETGLAPDYINAWMGLGCIKSGLATVNDDSCWQEVLRYEEYLRGKKYPYCEKIISDSNPKKISLINKFADEFNGIREKLKNNKDRNAAIYFFNQASLIIRGF